MEQPKLKNVVLSIKIAMMNAKNRFMNLPDL